MQRMAPRVLGCTLVCQPGLGLCPTSYSIQEAAVIGTDVCALSGFVRDWEMSRPHGAGVIPSPWDWALPFTFSFI